MAESLEDRLQRRAERDMLLVTTAALALVLGFFQLACVAWDPEEEFDHPPESTYVASTLELLDGDSVVEVQAARVTPEFFEVIDRPLWLGRSFVSQDFVVNAVPVAILTHRLWEEALDGRPEIIGRTVQLDGRSYEIVGVMRPGIEWPPEVDLWVPERGQTE